MSGTLAIWCEPSFKVLTPDPSPEAHATFRRTDTDPSLEGSSGEHDLRDGRDEFSSTPPPRIELHFNLWRDLETGSDFFDIGLRIDPTKIVRRLLLFIPGRIEESQFSDLSSLLKHSSILNVVFNDVVRITNRSDSYFDTSKRNENFTRVHSVDVDADLKFEYVAIDSDRLGTIIAFGDDLCSRFQEQTPGSHYIRFRINLTDETRELFSSEIMPKDWWLLSSFYPTELIEFRLNERRSIPPSVIDWFEKGPLLIHTIHYFLIRDVRYELVVQHRDFSKIRMLEADLWKHYLRGRHPEGPQDLGPIPSLTRDRLVIYHWKDRTQTVGKIEIGVADFNAFAKFQSPRSRLAVYALAIVLLGATGSALQAIAFFGAQIATDAAGYGSSSGQSSWIDYVGTLIILASAVLMFPILLEALRRSKKAVAGWPGTLRDRLCRNR